MNKSIEDEIKYETFIRFCDIVESFEKDKCIYFHEYLRVDSFVYLEDRFGLNYYNTYQNRQEYYSQYECYLPTNQDIIKFLQSEFTNIRTEPVELKEKIIQELKEFKDQRIEYYENLEKGIISIIPLASSVNAGLITVTITR